MGFFEIFGAALAGFYSVIPSFGLAIILLTVVTRIILLPLSIKQTRSMREMQRIQPEVKKLQQKHKGDRQKMNEEMMALYKEHGVNPFGGCLPLLMQFPFLISLYWVIRAPLKYLGYTWPEDTGTNAIVPIKDYVVSHAPAIVDSLRNTQLTNDLREHAVAVNNFIGLRLDCSTSAVWQGDPSPSGIACGPGLVAALPYFLLIALMGFTTWYQQKQMQSQNPSAGGVQAQQMQLMGRIMPAFLMFIAYSFPTGVVIYWLTTNVWTIGQQRLMLRVAPALGKASGNGSGGKEATGELAYGNGNPPAPSPPSKPHPSSKKKRKKR